jgi:hypothetical protein
VAALTPRYTESLRPEAAAALPRLATRDWCPETYLAGSAALALYLRHRRVAGLDLMTPSLRLRGPDRRDLLQDLLTLDPATRVETARDGLLYVRLGCGTALRLFYYPYPLIAPVHEVAGIEIAAALDLALMKVAAIISRGTRRDFVDLFLICRELPLERVLERSADKFGHVRDFRLQALKALADLSLIDGEPMPRLRAELGWQEVETWLTSETRRLGREHVGLDRTRSE